MGSRIKSALLAACVGAALLTSACVRKPPAGVYELSYASPYPPSHPFSRADIDWMKWIQAQSHGRIRIKPFWADGLISSDQSMIELRHGVADIGLITPIYARGGAHMLRAQSGFYGGVATIADQLKVYDCVSRDFPAFADELRGLHILAVQGGSLPALITRSKPVRTLDDLKGLRLRAPVEVIPVLKSLGADPVNMPMNDVYSALAKGVLDGVVAPGDTLKTLHFAEVAHNDTQLAIARGAYPARAMAQKTYDRLPPDLQALVDRSRTVWEAALSKEINGSVQAGEAFGKKNGVSFLPASPEMQARWDAAYNAGALASARDLKAYGLDGEPVFRKAQAVVSQIRQGQPVSCALPQSGL
jgi:TRAP-type C4-dicarboxylate transport system substrate-binding protein